MSQPISRSTPLTAEGELTAMTQELLILATAAPAARPEAFITVQGLGEYHRVTRTYETWKASGGDENGSLLIIAGSNTSEDTFVEMTKANLIGVFGFHEEDFAKLGEQIIIQPSAINTPDQAKWVARVLEEYNISLAAFGVTTYHLLRAFCTLLAEQRRAGTLGNTLVVPRLMDMPPTDIIPETGVSYGDAIGGELARMLKYAAQGDVATCEEFMDYAARLRSADVLHLTAR